MVKSQSVQKQKGGNNIYIIGLNNVFSVIHQVTIVVVFASMKSLATLKFPELFLAEPSEFLTAEISCFEKCYRCSG